MIETPLFTGPNICLTAIDPEKDAAVEAGWTYDLDYVQWVTEKPARPLGALALKKHHEEQQKKAEDNGNQIYWAVRRSEDNELVGFVRIPVIFWSHANAIVYLSFGTAETLTQYGREALELALTYGFTELNLYRMETALPSYRTDAAGIFEQAGFVLEVRRRNAFYRAGQYWDALHYGILRREWQARRTAEVAK